MSELVQVEPTDGPGARGWSLLLYITNQDAIQSRSFKFTVYIQPDRIEFIEKLPRSTVALYDLVVSCSNIIKYLTHLCRVDSSTWTLWTSPFSVKEVSGQFSLLPFIEMLVINANRVDPDQTPRSAASDLDLHYLSMSHLWDARHKWVTWSSS